MALNALSSLPLLTALILLATRSKASLPLNCSDVNRVCESFISYNLAAQQTLAEVQSLFDALPKDITAEEGRGSDTGSNRLLFVNKKCSCLSTKQYLINTTFTVRRKRGSLGRMLERAYEGLAWMPNNASRNVHLGAVVSLQLFCGCSSSLWNYLLTYVAQPSDSLAYLASRFGVSMQDIETVNNIADPNFLSAGTVYYIPLNSVPGVPYRIQEHIAPTPSPSATFQSVASDQGIPKDISSGFSLGWILGIVGIALLLILAVVLMWILRHKLLCCQQTKDGEAKNHNVKDIEKHPILCRSGSCFPSRGSFCWKGDDISVNASSNRQISLSTDMVTGVFDVEKPVVFTYEEILASTEDFKDTNLLGQGAFGTVYFGILRDQEVAIKKMTATKTKEFLVEMKVLCRVHHTNLVELIGYAASEDELFLVYEFAHKSSVSSRLHDPLSKGYAPLSWNTRVQIALDAARGLEYIHEHTKAHYVHRDIKTSNILLDNCFRAKISDFGLAKLVGKAGEGEASVTRVVGTFGYLAPEYLHDGQATTKSDVYAFGVVLFELISGKEAVAKNKGVAPNTPERRTLVSIMLSALRDSPSSISMNSLMQRIDLNMMDLYPRDCVYKMAMLAKQCVEEDPILRPDMKQVVLTLSQILLSSVEWEAALAGNSQVFSGLIQGR
ncbi:lysM domain receptor-like kinase 3 isoform X1 [Cryptomeria japonica]|uniref:lysM domain receptor-like kinase 3 isoform X1 n=1 Tax=Cryptomeria japonica TaxID=3369 RepID=UPI0027DA78C3|nr:lysM domain receptor-like kinase 3 isoform X1 [Cryptomeria japonica]